MIYKNNTADSGYACLPVGSRPLVLVRVSGAKFLEEAELAFGCGADAVAIVDGGEGSAAVLERVRACREQTWCGVLAVCTRDERVAEVALGVGATAWLAPRDSSDGLPAMCREIGGLGEPEVVTEIVDGMLGGARVFCVEAGCVKAAVQAVKVIHAILAVEPSANQRNESRRE